MCVFCAYYAYLFLYTYTLNGSIINCTRLDTNIVLLCLLVSDTQENPELIWNDESREKVCDTVKKLADKLVTSYNWAIASVVPVCVCAFAD